MLENREILTVMFSTSNTLHYSKLAERINEAYCKLHGYGFVHEVYDDTRMEPQYEKILLISKHIATTKYLVWIDSDACFIDFSKPITDFISESPSSNIIVAGNKFGFDFDGNPVEYKIGPKQCGINTGVAIFRNTSWTTEFLFSWWRQCVEGKGVGKPAAYWDQGHFQDMFLSNTMNVQSHTYLVIPAYLLNREDDGRSDWSRCDFVLHLWGADAASREEKFQTILDGKIPRFSEAMELPNFNIVLTDSRQNIDG